MDSKEYVKNALKTESIDFETIKLRLQEDKFIRVLHALVGLNTEQGEMQDAVKKYLFYGKKFDAVNMAEEIGDVFWYLAILSDALDVDFESIMDKNIAKLKARYGDKFSEEAAINRKLDIEREILEKVE